MEKSMKKVKLIVWAIILGFAGLFIFQNQTYFLTKSIFKLNFVVWQCFLPAMYNAFFALVFFGTGLILAFLFRFLSHFKIKLTLCVIILGFAALFIFQNQTYFLAKSAFSLNLGIRQFLLPAVNNIIFALVFFGSGIMFTFLFNFSPPIKVKTKTKNKKASFAPKKKKDAGIKRETHTLKTAETSAKSGTDEMITNC